MKRLLGLVVLVGACASPGRVILGLDPATGEQAAYTTVFLGDDARMVLSTHLTPGSLIHLAIWTAPTSPGSTCDVAFRVMGHDVRPAGVSEEDVAARFGEAEEEADVDHVVEFSLPPTVLDGVTQGPSSLQACGRTWDFDDDDRRTILELREMMSP